MKKRIEEIQGRLKRKKIDALLVTQPENRRYLSGYSAHDTSISESSGVLLILARGKPRLFTDSRYHLQAESEAAGFDVALYPKGLFSLLSGLLARLSIKRLAFESHYFLHASFRKFSVMAEKRGVELVPLTGLIEQSRVQKEEEEIHKISKSVAMNEAVFQEVYKGLRAGQTEREIAMKIETAMLLKGAEGPSFQTIVAGGPNAAMPHAVPTDRPIMKGETVIIDMGLILDGYCSDMTRTVVLGKMDEITRDRFRLVREAQQAGMRQICEGESVDAVDRAARKIIARAGYGERFGHGLGHGVGLAVHEAPSLNRRSRKKLKSGMVVTVEPGIYIPGWGGIRLENMVVVGDHGCENLNADTTFLDV